MKFLTQIQARRITEGLLFIMTLCALNACANYNTLDQRIAARQADFARLSSKHQQLVRRGEIEQGMSPIAVSIAWGSPDQHSSGERDGKRFERWSYTRHRAQPISSVGVVSGFGYWGGPWGGYRWWGGPAFRNDIVWIPEEVARVEFINQKVDSWRIRRP